MSAEAEKPNVFDLWSSYLLAQPEPCDGSFRKTRAFAESHGHPGLVEFLIEQYFVVCDCAALDAVHAIPQTAAH